MPPELGVKAGKTHTAFFSSPKNRRSLSVMGSFCQLTERAQLLARKLCLDLLTSKRQSVQTLRRRRDGRVNHRYLRNHQVKPGGQTQPRMSHRSWREPNPGEANAQLRHASILEGFSALPRNLSEKEWDSYFSGKFRKSSRCYRAYRSDRGGSSTLGTILISPDAVSGSRGKSGTAAHAIWRGLKLRRLR